VLSDTLQNFNNNGAFVHEGMIGTMDDFDLTPFFAHISFHPPDSVLGDLLIFVPVPYPHLVRIRRVLEAPGSVVVIENL
jgi:hypothetical protein